MNIPTSSVRNPIIVALITATTLLLPYQMVQAEREPPTQHQGVSVVNLGVLPESSLDIQLGLKGYKMQLREITLAPGGQIARHDHYNRPGLVWTLDGSWVEGRPAGEEEFPDSRKEAILEDATTDHWFWNDGEVPARVVVCDIVPAD